MRLRRKLNNRKPVRRVSAPTSVGIPVAAPARAQPALWRMRCMCGTILEISSEDDGRRQGCPTCRRRFDIRFTDDLTSGQKGVSLLYVGEENRKNGETSTVGAGTTSFQLPGSSSSSNPHNLEMEPELPDEAHFKCACGVLLAIARSQYEKRARCPSCNARMLVFMLFDSRHNTFNLQLFSLVDRSTGSTQVLSKL
jgi:hypothetical protein